MSRYAEILKLVPSTRDSNSQIFFASLAKISIIFS